MCWYSYVVIVVILFSSVCCLEEGESCTITSSGRQGLCITILKCPEALALIQKQQFPQTCGFSGTVPRVCCPGTNTVTTTSTSTERTTSRSTTKRRTTKPSTNAYPNPYRPNTTGYKSFQKCVEYSNLVISYEKPPILFIDKEEEEVDTCGFKVVPLIIGGVPADRREFPHMVLVGYDSSEGVQWLCGGTLINEQYVLTAGHCLISRELGNASRARLGVTKINDPEHRQDFAIIERIRHPKYEPPSHYNDIGLLKLDKSVNFDRYARPACLYYDSKSLNLKGVASGWGKTDFAGYSSDELLKVTLELVDTKTCNNSYRRVSHQRLDSGIIETTQLCAGSPGKDTCQGDSGGPLQIYSAIKCMYEVIGVTSFGKACGIGKSPGVYTRVSYYLDWIEKTVWG
ncbi:hypothetical protein WA026_007374 [Henosepilachna vigintioctopunctata]|uniref:CLIP domain-containing serine protease n=1 Tax=Henosepilachna vigintioctopunctata TaxID=420089 RepID=A0AAW1UM08_9CUCU